MPFTEQISSDLSLLSTWTRGWEKAVLSQITTYQINRTHPSVEQTENMSTKPQIIVSRNALFPARDFNKDSLHTPFFFFFFLFRLAQLQYHYQFVLQVRDTELNVWVPLLSPNSLSFLRFECQNTACRGNASRQAMMRTLRGWWGAVGSPSLEGYRRKPFIPLWPPELTVTPTKWTALLLKLFNCSLIGFIILLIQISAVSSEWKICIAWIILTRGPFNFCQQYFTAPIRAHSHWCCSPLGMSADSTPVPNHQGAERNPRPGYYDLQWWHSRHCTGPRAASLGISDGLWPCWTLGYRFPFLSPQ